MKPKVIDKINTVTIKFLEDNKFYVLINGKNVMKSGFSTSNEELKKLARTLSRIALTHYHYLDNINTDIKV